MSGRNVSMSVHAFQSLNKSLFECVDCHMFHMIHPGRLLQGLVARDNVEAVDMQWHFPATLLRIERLAEPASRSNGVGLPLCLQHVRPSERLIFECDSPGRTRQSTSDVGRTDAGHDGGGMRGRESDTVLRLVGGASAPSGG